MLSGIPISAKLDNISVIAIIADKVPITTEDVSCVIINQKTYADIAETTTWM